MQEITISINPGRVLHGLSRIGYTPASAICDIIDNSVMAGAKNISVLIQRDSPTSSDAKRGNVLEYIVVDDGSGMSEDQMMNALQLGSSEEYYEPKTLSKFGLGLKSATFSQGDTLQLISSKDGNKFVKFVVNMRKVQERGSYFAVSEELSVSDMQIISKWLPNGVGTVVRVSDIRKEGHPSIRQTTEELNLKVGVIYYYYMKENGVKISIDSKEIVPYDVLFSDEADTNGNLDENEWDGRTVKWIKRTDSPEILDIDANISAYIQVTQLPHPPTFSSDSRGGDKVIRDKYNIGAGNYGFYVYRNKRLISWADSLNGIIPQDQNYYSFRGRILIDDTADEAFNIDVKKSTITLSQEAWNTISDKSLEYKRKSKKAWDRAAQLISEKKGNEPNLQANQIVDEVTIPDIVSGQSAPSDEVSEAVEREIIERMRGKIESEKERNKKSNVVTSGRNGDKLSDKTDKEYFEEALKGELNPHATKIFRVPFLEDNKLWEPYYDAEHGHCVRINRCHRFAKLIFEDNAENSDLQIIFELLLHQWAVSEVESLKRLKHDFDNLRVADLQRLLDDFRRYTSEYLAHLVRHQESNLPPRR